jgi:AraC-like DNA-binding protein
MRTTDDPRRLRFWRPECAAVSSMLRVEREDRVRTTYSEHFLVVVVYEGAFDGWYRGAVRTHVAGAIKLKEPGEVHRDLRVHAPFTIQGAGFAPETVAAAAAALGLRAPPHFRASGFGPGEPATELAFAMHAALVRPGVPELERATRVAETLAALLDDRDATGAARGGERAPRAVRRARAFLHDALADKITLDQLAAHAGLDKFRLVRAFRAEVGLPPYEYLTYARVAKARELLQRGARVAVAAQAVGFCDESQLHRHFRRIVGITPGRFARSFAGRARNSQHRPIGARATTTDSPHDATDAR